MSDGAMRRAIAEAQAAARDAICSEDEAVARLNAASHFPRALLPNVPGVYVLDDPVLSVVLYVGESRNLYRRLMTHERGYLYRDGARLRILPCRNHKRVERWIIKAVRPTLNGVSEHTRRVVERSRGKTPAQVDQEFGEMWDMISREIEWFVPRKASAA